MILRVLKEYNIKNLKKLNGFHNQIYEGRYLNKDIIIRVSNRRTPDEVIAEIEILNKIKKEVRIGEPILVNNKHYLLHDNKIIVFFNKVSGVNWFQTKLSGKTHFNAGKELGLLHHSMQKINNTQRMSYEKHPDIKLIINLKPMILMELEETLSIMETWRQKKFEYGLIHGDYLFSNLIYNNEEVTIIDFDDVEYNYYLYDVAVYLFYLLLGGDPSNIDVEPNIDVFNSFIAGYRSVNQVNILDFKKIQTLFRLRQLKLYATISAIPLEKQGEWQKNYIKLMEDQISHRAPFTTINYELLYNK
jgi:Ser/Thr protein kinase RdoA (MazF antagonist)